MIQKIWRRIHIIHTGDKTNEHKVWQIDTILYVYPVPLTCISIWISLCNVYVDYNQTGLQSMGKRSGMVLDSPCKTVGKSRRGLGGCAHDEDHCARVMCLVVVWMCDSWLVVDDTTEHVSSSFERTYVHMRSGEGKKNNTSELVHGQCPSLYRSPHLRGGWVRSE